MQKLNNLALAKNQIIVNFRGYEEYHSIKDCFTKDGYGVVVTLTGKIDGVDLPDEVNGVPIHWRILTNV